ncbi:hypothetical protein J6590_021502 [Homalodisca vitripennis]|nr:hypothetical protein J6590_021502 [Homalodisca vitripennis]
MLQLIKLQYRKVTGNFLPFIKASVCLRVQLLSKTIDHELGLYELLRRRTGPLLHGIIRLWSSDKVANRRKLQQF